MRRIVGAIMTRIRSLFHKCAYGAWGLASSIHNPMRIIGKRNIYVGNHVYILDGLRMEAIKKWKEVNYSPCIKIDDRVSIGQNCHITCANRISIEKGATLLPDVLITDIEHKYQKGKSIGETEILVGSVRVKEYAVIGMGARILGSKNIVIGTNAVIGANAVVSKDVPDYAIVAGAPARIIGYVEN